MLHCLALGKTFLHCVELTTLIVELFGDIPLQNN